MNHIELEFVVKVSSERIVTPANKNFLKNGLQFHMRNIVAADLGVPIKDIDVEVKKLEIES